MKQAKDGKIEKTVLVAKVLQPKGGIIQKSPHVNKPKKKVQFADIVQFGKAEARARSFDKEEPAIDVAFTQSKEYKKAEKARPIVKDNSPVEVVNLPQKRKIPPISLVDTMGVGGRKPVNLFADNAIVGNLNIIRRVQIEDSNAYIEYTQHGKAIIQQQATRGCVAAVIAMFMVDAGRRPILECCVARILQK